MSHIHEEIDFIVNAFIIYKDKKVLLVDHIKAQSWLPIGGHIELNEDPDTALFREIEEECGLKKDDLIILTSKAPFSKDKIATPLYTPNFVDIHNIFSTNTKIKEHKHIALNYFLKSNTDKVKLEKGAHKEIKWFDDSELDEEKYALMSFVKIYAIEALKKAREE